MSAFLHRGVPVFEIRDARGMTDLLVRDPHWAAAGAIARRQASALMRGPWQRHSGFGPSHSGLLCHLYRGERAAAVEAISLGGSINYVAPDEGKLYEPNIAGTIKPPVGAEEKKRPLGK